MYLRDKQVPMKRLKQEDNKQLKLSQVLYAKRFDLTVDRKLCKGCVICTLACPREAITLKPLPKDADGKAQPPEHFPVQTCG